MFRPLVGVLDALLDALFFERIETMPQDERCRGAATVLRCEGQQRGLWERCEFVQVGGGYHRHGLGSVPSEI